MREKFPEGWNPPRKLSRETMDGMRALHAQDRLTFSTSVLAERFRVSPEAVRRILRSKWSPSKAEKAKILEKDRRRKEEHIAKSLLKEKEERVKSRRQHREEDDGFTLV
ncbi:hypothetical protein EW145_g209 [Phellinidium pouzarii]|uniref:Required for respiratory growth protein 9, mitochondrial n=1 Tax=Phellinidium pouzarii TaxID=167371 RepID=A0A4S4LJX8_9AGAM|nr:hypothetical protein EW145_g209 [Phellinidium pouzarii]